MILSKFGEDNVLPTFVAPEARQESPVQPTGIERCDDATLLRWRTDEHRYPPYQYQLSAGLIDDKLTQWRPANVRERELLLKFRVDHTLAATTAAEAKANPIKAQDARAILLGNSLHAGIVAHLFWELLH